MVLILVGGIVFGYLGEFLAAYVPFLAKAASGNFVGIPAVSLNLMVVKLSFSLLVKANLFTVVGFIAGYLVYRRL